MKLKILRIKEPLGRKDFFQFSAGGKGIPRKADSEWKRPASRTRSGKDNGDDIPDHHINAFKTRRLTGYFLNANILLAL